MSLEPDQTEFRHYRRISDRGILNTDNSDGQSRRAFDRQLSSFPATAVLSVHVRRAARNGMIVAPERS